MPHLYVQCSPFWVPVCISWHCAWNYWWPRWAEMYLKSEELSRRTQYLPIENFLQSYSNVICMLLMLHISQWNKTRVQKWTVDFSAGMSRLPNTKRIAFSANGAGKSGCKRVNLDPCITSSWFKNEHYNSLSLERNLFDLELGSGFLYDAKDAHSGEKKIHRASLKLKTWVLQKTPSRKWKSEPSKYFQNIYPVKDLYPL